MSRKINESRSHYLPHQHIKDKLTEHKTYYTSDINGILLTMIQSGNDNKRNHNEKNSKTMSEAIDTRFSVEKVGNSKSNTNLLLFGQYSHTSTKQKPTEKSCIGCTPGGLSTTALNMNLSTISPLCTNVGCIGTSCYSKDANSSSRVSRSASPALGGNTSDNNRLKKLQNWLLIFFDVCFSFFNYFIVYIKINI